MSFLKDLRTGHRGEAKVKSLLESFGAKILEKQKELPGWDLSVLLEDRQFTIEVKADLMAQRTGNLAIEFWNTKKNQRSGLLVTQADYWCIVLRQKVVASSTLRLKQFLAKIPPKRIIKRAGDGNAYIGLYPLESFQGILLPLHAALHENH